MGKVYVEGIVEASALQASSGNSAATTDTHPTITPKTIKLSDPPAQYDLDPEVYIPVDARFHLDVTASDTPTTLDVDIEGLVEGAWVVLASFTQVGAVSTANESITITSCPQNVRAAWTIVGTSYTFSVAFNR